MQEKIPSKVELEDQIIEDIASFGHDPLGYVKYAYDWGHGELEAFEGPRTWQADVLDSIGKHLRDPEKRYMPYYDATASGHGIGKANNVDSLIPTPKGMIRAGDIVAGDYIFSDTGQAVLVNKTQSYKNIPFYRVTFDDRSYVDVSSGHLWKVKGRNARRTNSHDWQTLSVLEIIEKGVKRPNGKALARQWEIPSNKPVIYPESKNKLDGYIYGVWLGDGSKSSGSITNIDPEVWENIAFSYELSGKTKHGKYAQTPYGLVTDLKSNGLFGCTTYNASVDRRYIESNDRLNVLQGLLDTDGWVEQCGSVAFCSASKQLTLDIIEIARSLGLKARQEKFKENDCAGAWFTHITWDGETQLFRIKRKQSKLINPEARYKKQWIDSIEEIGLHDGICYSVEGSLYLTQSYHVTHNSALVGMVVNWAMDTMDDCRVVVTANTDGQLRSKTVPEVKKWFNLSITKDWFNKTATKIYSNDNEHSDAWRCDFLPWSKDNPDAFAGLHNMGKRILVIFDEASGIDEVIWETIEGALTDENTEIIFLAFGNPLRNKGRFRECWRKFSKIWKTRNIDSRDVEGTNKQQIENWRVAYGEESDFFKTRVMGKFPNQSALQYYPTDLVDAARGKHLRPEQFNFAPTILACDPAWEGDDDLVIGLRQGLMFKILEKIPKNSNDLLIAQKLALYEDEYKCDAVFVDGGYGTGIISAGRTMMRHWRIVWFGSKSARADCKNKRSEMLAEILPWLQEGGSFKDDQELYEELIALETGYDISGKLMFPKKEIMKKDLGRSPNCLDTLGLTFAYPVAKKKPEHELDQKPYDPMDRA